MQLRCISMHQQRSLKALLNAGESRYDLRLNSIDVDEVYGWRYKTFHLNVIFPMKCDVWCSVRF